VTQILTKLTALEKVVAEIEQDTKYSQAGAAIAAVSLILALIYVAVVCFVAARNLGKARQEEVLKKDQEKLDQAAERAAKKFQKRRARADSKDTQPAIPLLPLM
jgi:nitrate reductase cytochrome c-type subunit